MKIRSFVAWYPVGSETSGTDVFRLLDEPGDWPVWRAGALRMAFLPRDGSARVPSAADSPTLILGDDSEWTPGETACMASGVPVRWDASAAELSVTTSIVALPPVFLHRGRRVVALTSDLHLLRGVPGIQLELDPRALVELGHFGHPVGHRTLFRDTEIVAGGGHLAFGPKAGSTFRRAWSLPERERLDWPQFIEAQIDAFSEQVKRVDVSRSFLSLTAGLDTRTVFASLAAERRLVPAATMTGPKHSLDARIAGRLCRAYGIRHEAVTFDSTFVDALPRHIETASRLSGGLATLDQAPEVFLYDQLGAGFSARLSGNLGNQVGRGGTEGVSVRAADLGVLAPQRREGGAPKGHWLLEQLDRSEHETLSFIFLSEIPFTLVSNFSVGNHFAAQQSPYASRRLIETLAQRPRTRAGAPSGSKLRMRLRDLRHRFLGEPESHSFQRTLVKRLDGFAAECPVNWGWKPVGGVSPAGMLVGGATLFGMFARAKGLDGGVLRKPLEVTGLPALHDFRESRRWLRRNLESFTRETLQAQALRDANLFDRERLAVVLNEHFGGQRDHYHTVTFALDVGLAYRTFCR